MPPSWRDPSPLDRISAERDAEIHRQRNAAADIAAKSSPSVPALPPASGKTEHRHQLFSKIFRSGFLLLAAFLMGFLAQELRLRMFQAEVSSSFTDASDQLKERNSELVIARRENERLNAELTASRSSFNSLQSEMRNKTAQAERRISELSNENKTLKDRYANLSKDMSNLSDVNRALREEKAATQRQLTAICNELERNRRDPPNID